MQTRHTEFEKLIANQPHCDDSLDYSSEVGQDFRKGKLTSSDIVPGLIGLGYDSPFKTWNYYKGTEEKKVDGVLKELCEYGRKREPEIFQIVRKRFLKQTHLGYLESDFFTCGCFVKTDLITGLTIYSTPDGIFWHVDQYVCLEIKSRNPKYSNGAVECVEDIKPGHLVQMMCQMFCTGLKICFYATATEDKCILYYMHFDEKVIRLILDTLHEILKEGVGKRITKARANQRDIILEKLRARVFYMDTLACK